MQAGIAQPEQPPENKNFEGEPDPSIGKDLKEEPATEQEQAMYDALVEPMLGMVHGEKTKDQVVQALKGGMTVADLTFQIGEAIIGQIEQQGKEVPPDILQMAAEDVVEDLVEISVALGIVPDKQEEIEKAYIDGLMGAIDKYGEKMRKSGKITSEGGAAHIDEMTSMGGFNKTPVAQGVEQAVQPEQAAQPQQGV